MTALATGLALIQLALAIGQPGSEIQAPMAMVILFGLLTSTALNMVVVPALYLRFGQIGGRVGPRSRLATDALGPRETDGQPKADPWQPTAGAGSP
jgi:hypothetical protein